MKRLAGFSTLALIITGTSGCGWLWGDDGYFRDRGGDYLEASQTPAMQVPDGVQVRGLDPLLPIPRRVADLSVEPGSSEVPRPQRLPFAAESGDFSLQSSEDARWLVAIRTPAQVWTSVRQYLTDNGFAIADERPQTGELVTDWQSGARLDQALARNLGLPADKEIRVRLRVEPGVQRSTSEIFLVSVQRPAGSGTDVPWPETSSDKEVDRVLLDELHASLSRTAQEGDSVSLLAERDFDAPSRVALESDGSGSPLLRLDSSFDRAWSRIGRALEASDIRVDDLDRTLGLYYINLAESADKEADKPGFFARLFGFGDSKREIEARAERYQVRLTSVASDVLVTLEKDSDTQAPADVARRVLNQLNESLGQ